MKWFFDDSDDEIQTDLFNEKYYLNEVRVAKHAIDEKLRVFLEVKNISVETIQELCYLIDKIGFIYRHNQEVNYSDLSKELEDYHQLENLKKIFFEIDIYSDDLFNSIYLEQIEGLINGIINKDVYCV